LDAQRGEKSITPAHPNLITK